MEDLIKSLPRLYKTRKLNISIKFDSSSFLKAILSKILGDVDYIKPGFIGLGFYWHRDNLSLANRELILNFAKDLRKRRLGRMGRLPFCLPGGPNYEGIKKFVTPPDCDRCPFLAAEYCCGLTLVRDPNFYPMVIKDFDEVNIGDFLSSMGRKALTWWVPRREDIEKIVLLAEYLNKGETLPSILDFGTGQGFIAYLLAQTGRVKVVGIDPNEELIKKTKFKHKNLKLLVADDKWLTREWRGKFELVISSFMISDIDFTPKIKRVLAPKGVVYIGGKPKEREPKWKYYYLQLEIDERLDNYNWVANEDISFDPNDNYYNLTKWDIPCIEDLNKDGKISSPLSGEIRVQVRKGICNLPALVVHPKKRYKWESFEILKGMSNNLLLNKLKIEVGRILISVCSVDSDCIFEVNREYARFLSLNSAPEVTLQVHYGDIPSCNPTRLLFDGGGLWRLFSYQGKYIIRVGYGALDSSMHQRLAIFTPDFISGDIYVNRPESKANPYLNPIIYPLGELIMVNLLSLGRGILVHACGISYKGKGLIFAGTSRSGKSTLANLWKDKKDITVLSDDRIIVRKMGGGFWIYGTPWHGDAKVCSPERAPLKKIFFLKHAKKNSVKKMTPIEATSRLLVCSFPTFWDKKGMEFTLAFINKLIREIPCYELGFVPNKTAIDFIRNI